MLFTKAKRSVLSFRLATSREIEVDAIEGLPQKLHIFDAFGLVAAMTVAVNHHWGRRRVVKHENGAYYDIASFRVFELELVYYGVIFARNSRVCPICGFPTILKSRLKWIK